MPAVKPFRALRYVPARVELAAVLAKDASDPRRVAALLDDAPAPDDGVDAPLRRARLRLAEWRRAGILRADDAPALYALRRREDLAVESESESDDAPAEGALGLFCALGVESGVEAVPDAGREARLEKLGVAIEPVVAAFAEARARRTLENAIDRDPDATWRVREAGRDVTYELWSVDDESTIARIATLLSQAALTVEQNEAAWTAHAAWWRKRAPPSAASSRDDDGDRAGAFALAFLHHVDDAWADVPLGVALAPLTGALA